VDCLVVLHYSIHSGAAHIGLCGGLLININAAREIPGKIREKSGNLTRIGEWPPCSFLLPAVLFTDSSRNNKAAVLEKLSIGHAAYKDNR